jgi:hypothetical protein
MLKYLSIVTTTALVNIALVSTSSVQTANAATVSVLPTSSDSQLQLVARDEKSAHINSQQQSDIKNIHQTLTQFYRGLNEYSVERMARVAVPTSDKGKDYLRGMFAKLKQYQVDMTFEVENIELVSLSANNAVVKVSQVIKAKGPGKSISSRNSPSMALVKYRGQWKISDIGSVNQNR